MNTIHRFQSLAGQALDGPFYYWPITAIIVAGLALTSIFQFPFIRVRFCRQHFLLFVPLGFSLVILAWGALMENQPWAYPVVHVMFVFQLLASIHVIYKLKGYRWFALFFILLQLWFNLFFAFVAIMSATGDWM